jgi:acetylornithine/succinyldiaminopimelate/putrescine aminotransferase
VGALLITDEIQCGMGRTGTLWAYDPYGVKPDIMTVAKPLGGGLPMGAILVNDAIAAALGPGDHGTTFGGGPFVATVALDVVRTIADPDFLAEVRAKGEVLGARLESLARRSARVQEARGRGLMWGLELNEVAAPLVAAARERRLLVLTAGPSVIRIVPPLTITRAELERGAAILAEVLA